MTQLYCEFTLINRSDLRLHVATQTNIHGGWSGDDDHIVLPGQAARYTAKDPDFLAYGSEGHVTFTDDAGSTFTIGYCCSYGKNGNFAGITQGSALLDVTLRFANQVPPADADKEWGSAAPPPNGHPLGILIYVEKRPVLKRLKVMSYNAHLFKGSPAATIKPSTVQMDEERAEQILRKTVDSQADIVCLQEIWSLDCQRQMAQHFLRTYPYIYLAPDNTIDIPWWEKALSLMTGGFIWNFVAMTMGYDTIASMLHNSLTNTSGLLLASRYPIKDCGFSMYTGLAGDDKLAKKGVINFTVMLAGEHNTQIDVRMAATHCPTDINDALRVIETVAAPGVMQDVHVDRILLGDFNLHLVTEAQTPELRSEKRTEAEYLPLQRIMDKYGAKDVIDQYLPLVDNCYTDCQAENSLTWLLDRDGGEENAPVKQRNRIDYVYFAQRTGAPLALSPRNVSIPHDWEIKHAFDAFGRHFDALTLSDHYPVLTEFDVVRQDCKPYSAFRRQTRTLMTSSEYDTGRYALVTGAGLSAADDNDLYCIKHANCESGRIELHVSGANDGYSSWRSHAMTALPASAPRPLAYLVGDARRRNGRDLYYLVVGTRSLEVHILDSNRGYHDFLLQVETPIRHDDIGNFDFVFGSVGGVGIPDLYCIKRRNTSSQRLEVHVLGGLSNYQTFSLQVATDIGISEIDAGKYRFAAGRYQRKGGNADLYLLKCDQTGSGMLEVSILDGTDNFRSRLLERQATPIPLRDVAKFDFSVGNCTSAFPVAPLYCIKHSDVESGAIEVHILN